MLEVELKVRIPSPDPVRERLKQKKAEFLGRVHEHDIFYNAPHRDFGKTDEAVRVRYTGDHAVVTYKGPKIRKSGLKAREELNFAVESGEAFETMLDRLGFRKTLVVDKWRENFRLGDISVCLDDVAGLGTFAEIEVMAEDGADNPVSVIEKMALEIGVTGEPILESYLEMLLAKKAGKEV
ncbi:MAG: CYTH domain protein [Methanoregula sp. PtaU1.Bin006]|uniref:class IV adenylate cyclase n=1 Tax=Methanoregula sp. PtaU1.Bin006 TaxID=1811681 RepID=UPI0009CFC0AB|nr:class IV adenylate cyclase [Methanoregula sp. PtaU1.Bin006]OPY37279.1 MAG: CYTH domain protein [Methanoregula sp. PtaU1.Bin006]